MFRSLFIPSLLVACSSAGACALGNGNAEPAPVARLGPLSEGGSVEAGDANAEETDGASDATTDAAHDGEAGSSCSAYATPTVAAPCHGCGSKPCQANGCYGGYWCEVALPKCVPKPASCP